MPQIKNPWLICLVILLGSPVVTLYYLYEAGEVTSWVQMGLVLQHALPNALMAVVGWILFRSPWAAQISQLIISQQSQQGDVRASKETKVTLESPVPPEKPAA